MYHFRNVQWVVQFTWMLWDSLKTPNLVYIIYAYFFQLIMITLDILIHQFLFIHYFTTTFLQWLSWYIYTYPSLQGDAFLFITSKHDCAYSCMITSVHLSLYGHCKMAWWHCIIALFVPPVHKRSSNEVETKAAVLKLFAGHVRQNLRYRMNNLKPSPCTCRTHSLKKK